ncbi:MAG: hypothetical protein J6Y00_00820 [Paludibacteraceae bacterium]|nr:hypothetical protein [Paludibacteraceae bacterium]
MRKCIIMVIACLLASMTFAQDQAQTMDDAARIALSAYMDPSSSIPNNAKKTLIDRMQKIITKNGMGSVKNTRFIMTANVRELNLEKSETAPVIYLYNLEVNFYIGDGIDGTLFSSCSLEVNAAGDSKEKAYMAALKKIKASNPQYQAFIEEGKKRIVDYYTAKCDFIITQAQTKAKNQDFDAALAELMQVPDVCKECYDKCMAAAQPIYQEKINQEGAKLLAEARGVWSAGQDVAAAEAAAAILAQINPQSTAFAGAESLNAEIAKRVKELDKREWDFQLKQQKDQVDLEKASIKAIRDIGVAYGENQQPTTYNVVWW